MSTAVTATEQKSDQQPVTAPSRPLPSANIELTGDIINNPAMFEHVQRLAILLADGAFTPGHLKRNTHKETVATCFRVAAQAIRWGFDPFGVADETYEIKGKLGYQGKLVIAVINSRANLKENLRFDYSGSGTNREVTVTGHIKNEAEPRTITLAVNQAKTSNDMWLKDPDQKLAYTGATKWARRHCPQVLMGVQTIEDLEAVADSEKRTAVATSLDALTERFGGKVTPAAQLEAPQPEGPTRGTSDNGASGPQDWELTLNDCDTAEQIEAFTKVISKLPEDQQVAASSAAVAKAEALGKPKKQKDLVP